MIFYWMNNKPYYHKYQDKKKKHTQKTHQICRAEKTIMTKKKKIVLKWY